MPINYAFFAGLSNKNNEMHSYKYSTVLAFIFATDNSDVGRLPKLGSLWINHGILLLHIK
jgi:hypothetical protein